MAIAVTCRSVRRANGRIYIRWDDGSEQEFQSLQQLNDWIRSTVEGEAAKDFLRAVAVLKARRASPDMSTAAAALENKTITLDESVASNLVRLT